MGGEGGEGGALAEGRRCPCEACGSAAAAGGALTWHCARVSPRHVGRGRCALRLGRAGAGGRSLRAGHRAGGEGDGKAEKWKSGKAKAAKRGAASSISFASASPLSHRTPPPWPTSQSQRPSTTTSRRTQTPNSPSMKTTSSTSSTRRTTSESHTSHSHSHTLTPCSWWKAKLKDDAGGADGQVGLVPATYVEEVSHPSVHPCRCLGPRLGPRLGALLVHLEPAYAPLALPVIPLHLIRASNGTVDAPETMSPETT